MGEHTVHHLVEHVVHQSAPMRVSCSDFEAAGVYDCMSARGAGLLHDLGASTVSQDYIFFAYDHPV